MMKHCVIRVWKMWRAIVLAFFGSKLGYSFAALLRQRIQKMLHLEVKFGSTCPLYVLCLLHAVRKNHRIDVRDPEGCDRYYPQRKRRWNADQQHQR